MWTTVQPHRARLTARLESKYGYIRASSAKRSYLSPELVGSSVREGADLVAADRAAAAADKDAVADLDAAGQLVAADRQEPERLVAVDLQRRPSLQRRLHLPSLKHPQRRVSRQHQKVNRQHRADEKFFVEGMYYGIDAKES